MNPPNASIDQARIDDVAEIAAVHVGSWKAAYAGIVPACYLESLEVSQKLKMWSDFISQGTGEILAARLPGRIGGFCHILPSRDADRPMDTEVVALYVHPEFWRQGLGTLLLERAVARGRELGSCSLSLWVLEENTRGRKFYERQGMSSDGLVRVITIADAGLRQLRYALPLHSDA